MNSINGHCELVSSSPSISGGGYVTGTNGRQHMPFLAVVPDARYITMREVMFRFPGDEEMLCKAEERARCKCKSKKPKHQTACSRKRRAGRKTVKL